MRWQRMDARQVAQSLDVLGLGLRWTELCSEVEAWPLTATDDQVRELLARGFDEQEFPAHLMRRVRRALSWRVCDGWTGGVLGVLVVALSVGLGVAACDHFWDPAVRPTANPGLTAAIPFFVLGPLVLLAPVSWLLGRLLDVDRRTRDALRAGMLEALIAARRQAGVRAPGSRVGDVVRERGKRGGL